MINRRPRGCLAKRKSRKPTINLKVKGQDGNEVFCRIKIITQLKMHTVTANSVAFLFDGRRLRSEQTPDELEMEDGDEIDAMLHQTRGAAA